MKIKFNKNGKGTGIIRSNFYRYPYMMRHDKDYNFFKFITRQIYSFVSSIRTIRNCPYVVFRDMIKDNLREKLI